MMVKSLSLASVPTALKIVGVLGAAALLSACTASEGRWSEYNYGYNDVRMASTAWNLDNAAASAAAVKVDADEDRSEAGGLMSLMPFYNSNVATPSAEEAEEAGDDAAEDQPVKLSTLLGEASDDAPTASLK